MSTRGSCPGCFTQPADFTSIAIVAPWIRELANVKKRFSKYYVCSKCRTGWADINYTTENMELLYKNYRGERYLKVRRKWENSYSESFNASIDGGEKHMSLRRNQMEALILKNSPNFISESVSVLDIGGGHGSLIPNWSSLNRKYVLDVSGVETLDGIQSIANWSDLPSGQLLSLVMACGILEHVTSPKEFLESIIAEVRQHSLMNSSSLFYFEVPAGVPVRKRMYFKILFAFTLSFIPYTWRFFDQVQLKFGREHFPLRVAEHIQFFTPSGMSALLSSVGLEFIEAQTYSASDSLDNSESIRFGEILGVVARLPR